MANRKWEIKGIKHNSTLKSAAKKILVHRLNDLTSAIKLFFQDDTEENLHRVRISLRRLRYNMESFISCFERKKFLIFYNLVENLQDLTGNKRDLDILKLRLSSVKISGSAVVKNSILKEIESESSDLKEKLKLELMKFIHSKELKDFLNILN